MSDVSFEQRQTKDTFSFKVASRLSNIHSLVINSPNRPIVDMIALNKLRE